MEQKKSGAQPLSPVLAQGKYFFGTFSQNTLMTLANYLSYIVAIYKEDEGLTVAFREEVKAPLSTITSKEVQGPFALITFGAQGSLYECGVTARFSKPLSDAKIPANVYAGYFHDHVFVPYEMKDKAMAALKKS